MIEDSKAQRDGITKLLFGPTQRCFLWSEDIGPEVVDWWICHSSPTSSMEGGSSWSKTARGRPPVDVSHQHVSRLICISLSLTILPAKLSE
jgi:hypothetical protein